MNGNNSRTRTDDMKYKYPPGGVVVSKQNDKEFVQMPSWLFIVMLMVFFVITVLSLYVTFTRVRLAGTSDSVATSGILMSPEIMQGLSDLMK